MSQMYESSGAVALTLAEAERMSAAAIKHAEQHGVRICVAVCDPGGTLIALSRMDNAIAVSPTGASGKAAAAAAFQRPSGALQPERPVLQALLIQLGGNLIPGRGGVPVFSHDGTLRGAVGVGGTTAELDEECAEAGVLALRQSDD